VDAFSLLVTPPLVLAEGRGDQGTFFDPPPFGGSICFLSGERFVATSNEDTAWRFHRRRE
jgi:hypothetical protein